MSVIDTSFDFRSDTPPDRDPDKYSPTLRSYHQQLWSKPLPSGEKFQLISASDGGYLCHRSALGTFNLASDGMISAFLFTKRMSAIVSQVPEPIPTELQTLAYSIGGFILFPGNRIDNKMTINGARGCHRRIEDRFDLTLECIRRHYENLDHPLSEVLNRYANFFRLFVDFKGYIEFFLLQDLVSENGKAVRFFLPFDDFQRSALPLDAEEYVSYAAKVTAFLEARNRRMVLKQSEIG